MKPKIVCLIIFLIVSGSVLVYTAFAPTNKGHHPIWEPKPQPEQSQNFSKQNTPARKVNEESGGIVSYVLKYIPNQDKVVLITCYENGSKLMSDIPSIKPAYLEKEDIRMLTQGIETDSKESMYILIEDYSS